MEVCSSSDDSGADERTLEQKIWIKLVCLIRAVKPVLLYLFLPSGLVLIGMAVRGTKLPTREFIQASGNFYYGIGVLGTFYFLYKAAKKKGNTLFQEISFGGEEISYKYLILLYLMGLACGIFLSVLLTAISYVSPMLKGYEDMSRRTYDGKDFLILLFTVGLSAPVVEEVIFRGYMYQRLKAGFTKRDAVLISSFLFAICHVSLMWIAYAFAAGIFLCRLFEKKQTILFPILFHAGFNMSSIVIYVLTVFWEIQIKGAWIGVLGAAAGGAGLICWKIYEKGVWKEG